MSRCSKIKIVVFDLDETLGYFSEFGMIWDSLTQYIKKNIPDQNLLINQLLFDKTLDLFPEFLRPKILSMLSYIKQKKIESKCNKLILYTNNQGPTEWAKYIIKYFENKLKYKLFDQIIAAYKINGRQVEMCRTTQSKTHEDLLKCTNLSQNTEICFLDDIYHPGMDNNNIYYINVKPYKYDLNFTEIINRIINSNILNNISENEFKEEYIKNLNKYHYSPKSKHIEEQNVDKVISKQILYYLTDFFNETTRQNRKKTNKHYRKNIKNKTLKIKK